MGKQNAVYPYNGILLSNKKEWACNNNKRTDVCNNMAATQNNKADSIINYLRNTNQVDKEDMVI